MHTGVILLEAIKKLTEQKFSLCIQGLFQMIKPEGKELAVLPVYTGIILNLAHLQKDIKSSPCIYRGYSYISITSKESRTFSLCIQGLFPPCRLTAWTLSIFPVHTGVILLNLNLIGHEYHSPCAYRDYSDDGVAFFNAKRFSLCIQGLF